MSTTHASDAVLLNSSRCPAIEMRNGNWLGRGVRLLGTAILVFAAVEKYRSGPIEGWGIELHLALIVAELLAAAALLTNITGKWTLRGGATLFLMLAAVAAGKWAAGEDSCGCFGKLTLRPVVTLSVDLVMAGLFGVAERFRSDRTMVRFRLRAAVFGVSVVAVVIVFAFLWRQQTNADENLAAAGTVQGGVVYLEPRRWVGHTFPLKPLVAGAPYFRGRWVVLIHQPGCELCERALPRYVALAAQSEMSDFHLAMISLTSVAAQPMPDSVSLTLPPNHQWFAATPIALIVIDGQVTRVAQGEAAVDPNALLLGQ